MLVINPDGSIVDAKHGISVYFSSDSEGNPQRVGFSNDSKKIAERLVGATIESWEPGYNMKVRFTDGRKLVVVCDGDIGFYIVNYEGPWDVGAPGSVTNGKGDDED